MKAITLKTPLIKNQSESVKAYASDDFKGLAVHKSSNGRWSVSHIGSGLNATQGYTFKTRTIAATVAKQIASLTDWTNAVEVCVSDLSRDDVKTLQNIVRDNC